MSALPLEADIHPRWLAREMVVHETTVRSIHLIPLDF
jgi:hypothetical protein